MLSSIFLYYPYHLRNAQINLVIKFLSLASSVNTGSGLVWSGLVWSLLFLYELLSIKDSHALFCGFYIIPRIFSDNLSLTKLH